MLASRNKVIACSCQSANGKVKLSQADSKVLKGINFIVYSGLHTQVCTNDIVL